MDKYVKIKKIGEGSFGKALLVRSKSTNEQMVVKEINMNKVRTYKLLYIYIIYIYNVCVTVCVY